MEALHKNGITWFLESWTLIGYTRHAGRVVPWDNDGDVGIIFEECLKWNIGKRDL